MASLINGKEISQQLIDRVKEGVAELARNHDTVPGLAVVLVGEDPASHVYVRNKIRRAEEVGIRSLEYRLAVNTSQQELNKLITELNANPDVHGILVQLPLPDHLDEKHVIATIDPRKDVDGFHPMNVGALASGMEGLVPCTPLGCLMMLKSVLPELSGKTAVVIGRSNIVGKPMASLLQQENCTVTTVHSHTKNIETVCAQADIVIAAIGKAEFVGMNWIKPGAVVIDVGINAVERDGKRKLVGDVDFQEVAPIASAITPVPGGVGPMTIACLMKNTLAAAEGALHA